MTTAKKRPIKKKKPCLDTFIKKHILYGLNNATKAAIDAGYTAASAPQTASRLIKTDKVKKAVAEHQAKLDSEFVWNKEKKLEKLQTLIDYCMNKIVDAQGNQRLDSPSGAVAAIKEHNAMLGHNAAVKTETTLKVDKSLAERLTGGSKK